MEDLKSDYLGNGIATRWCVPEKQTNQFLGYEGVKDEKGRIWSEALLKHFRY